MGGERFESVGGRERLAWQDHRGQWGDCHKMRLERQAGAKSCGPQDPVKDIGLPGKTDKRSVKGK